MMGKDQQKLRNLCAMPKLRTYNLIIDFTSSKAYLWKPLSFTQREAMAKIRLGVLPIRLETGRYERPKLVAEQRFCQQCTLNLPENEIHCILECPSTSFNRDKLLNDVNDQNFPFLQQH